MSIPPPVGFGPDFRPNQAPEPFFGNIRRIDEIIDSNEIGDEYEVWQDVKQFVVSGAADVDQIKSRELASVIRDTIIRDMPSLKTRRIYSRLAEFRDWEKDLVFISWLDKIVNSTEITTIITDEIGDLDLNKIFIGDIINNFSNYFGGDFWNKKPGKAILKKYLDQLIKVGDVEEIINLSRDHDCIESLLPDGFNKDGVEYEQWLEEMVEEKLFFADVFANFEDYLLKANSEGSTQDIVDRYLQQYEGVEFPIYVVRAMTKISDGYMYKKIEHDNAMIYFNGEVDTDDKVVFGRYIFEQVTSKQPKNDVYCRDQEGYLVLSFDDEEDFREFNGDDEGVKASGTYYGAMTFGADRHAIDVLAIGHHEKYSFFHAVVTHERQHFINHIINLSDVERLYTTNKWRFDRDGVDGVTPDYARFPGSSILTKAPTLFIKDELLSFLRDGTPLKLIPDSLDDELYRDLYSDKKEAKEISDILSRITELLSNPLLKELQFNRQRLVYLLLDVPLGRMESFVDKLIFYFEKQKESVAWSD